MPPRKSTRSAKGKQPEATQAAVDSAPPPPAPEEVEAELNTAQPVETTAMEEREAIEQGTTPADKDQEREEEDDDNDNSAAGPSSGVDLSERMNKLKELRKRMVRMLPSACGSDESDQAQLTTTSPALPSPG